MDDKILNAIRKGDVTELEQIGSQANVPIFKLHNKNNQNILHIGAEEGKLRVVQWILDHDLGSLLNGQDSLGWTPLHFACNAGHLDVVLCLLERGANAKAVTLEGNSTPLHYLAKQDLYPRGMGAESQGEYQTKSRGSMAVTSSMMSLKATVPSAYNDIHRFLSKLKITTEKELPLRIVELMLAQGVNINCYNSNNQTPLFLSCLHGYKNNAKLFLMKGAFLFEKSKTGETVFDIAEKRRDESLSQILFGFANLIATWIPDEVLEQVFSYLPPNDLLSITQVCVRFAEISRGNQLWYKSLQQVGHSQEYDSSKNYRQLAILFSSGSYIETSNIMEMDWNVWLSMKYRNYLLRNNNTIPKIKQFNIAVIGDRFVGKTSAILRFTDFTFTTYVPSNAIPDNKKSKTVKLLGKNTQLDIWDAMGWHNGELDKTLCSQANAFIVCFSCQDRQSFSKVDGWISDIRKYAKSNPIVLVGTKAEHDRTISSNEASTYAQKKGIPYVEISALLDVRCSFPFMLAACLIIGKKMEDSNNDNQSLTSSPSTQKSDQCCVM